ncbi:MAG: hypothetical protein VB078_00655 [Clostridiaceae bacterium]|nr:hypothetical protein [Clostridiaceae bacterium]
MQKKSFSWGIIILLFILFFPVGILMLVKKMSDEKYNYLKNGKALKTFGWVLFGIGIFYLIMGLTGELKTEDGSSVVGGIIIMLILFCGGGLLMVFKGKQFVNRGAKFSRYVAIVNASNNTLIDNIAAAYPTTYDSAASDLQMMIGAGYFLNAYIDLNKRELVMPVIQSANNIVSNSVGNNLTTDTKPRTVKCPNCGATNTIIPGAADECEYCGSPL